MYVRVSKVVWEEDESYNNKLVCGVGREMEGVGKRCGGNGRIVDKKRVEQLKENHVFGEFENIVHIVRRRLKEVGVGSWRT